MDRQRAAYVILETEHDEKGYIPCIVKEGETGYYRTNWNWGHDLEQARRIATESNADLGLTPKDAERLFVESLGITWVEETQKEWW